MCYSKRNFSASCFLPFLAVAACGTSMCAQQGKNAAGQGGGCEMKKADPHSGFFCLRLNAFASGAPSLLQLGKM